MFCPRRSICSFVLGRPFFRVRRRSQGSSFKKRMHTSKVAPPQHSKDQNPMLSNTGRIGSMSSIFMRVAAWDWWASRRMVSMIFKGFLAIMRFIAFLSHDFNTPPPGGRPRKRGLPPRRKASVFTKAVVYLQGPPRGKTLPYPQQQCAQRTDARLGSSVTLVSRTGPAARLRLRQSR